MTTVGADHTPREKSVKRLNKGTPGRTVRVDRYSVVRE